MSDKTLPEIAKIMADIDFCHLVTRTTGGVLASRPMSSNADVDYDGDSHFFCLDTTRMVADISADPGVMLTFTGTGGVMGLVGKPGRMVAVQGRAEVIRDKAAFEAHWNPDLEYWFKEGTETPGLVMLKVIAHRIAWWDGEENGEYVA